MESLPNLERLPALPPHLNPYCPPKAIGRRFYLNNGPSPLRHSFTPEDDFDQASRCFHHLAEEGSHDTGSSSAYDHYYDRQVVYSTPSEHASSSMDSLTLQKPPGLECVATRPSYPDYVQDCLRKFHRSANMAFDWANRNQLTSDSKRVILEHMSLCLKMVKYYARMVEAELNNSGTYAAASEFRVLDTEIRGLKELRRQVEELSTR